MFFVLITFIVLALGTFGASFFVKNEEERVVPGGRYNNDRTIPASNNRTLVRYVAAGLGAVALVLGLFGSFYTQDAGEAKVQRSITGTLVGQSTTAGMHVKAPWVKVIGYDIRNNVISYVGKGETDNSGGSAKGPQITFQDKDGVTGNMDIAVRYSLKADSVLDIYAAYQTQEAFVDRVITNDVRSAARDIPANYGTLDVFKNRGEITTAIREALAERWAGDGIVVEEVSLQEIRYSEDTTKRFDEAQASRIAVDKSRADQDRAIVEAQTKVETAKGEAEANGLLAASLTDAVLRQHYIDALNNAGAIYVVPDGSTPLIQVPATK